MKKWYVTAVLAGSMLLFNGALAQETRVEVVQQPQEDLIAMLKQERERVYHEEKARLKAEVSRINSLLDKKEITEEEASRQKERAAETAALNIENRQAIIDNKIALAERGALVNTGELEETKPTIWFESTEELQQEFKEFYCSRYSKGTYSQLVMAAGFSNALVDGQGLEDSPYQLGGSRFFEIGWQWKTRLIPDNNSLRLVYGFSFQFNGLKPVDDQYFVKDGDLTYLADFEGDLDKSKLRMDNIVVPVFLEFNFLGAEERHRGHHHHHYFRMGLGGFAGVNYSTRQKLKYSIEGDHVKQKIKDDFNTNDLVYGLAAYAGFGDLSLYFKYELNELFANPNPDQNIMALGLRWEL